MGTKTSNGFQWLEDSETGNPTGVRRAQDGKAFSIPLLNDAGTSLVSGDRILPVLHFKPTTGTNRRTSTNTATDTVEQVLDTYIIPAGAVGINDAVETHFIGKTNTGIVAANFTLRMNGVSILATTGNASNAINSFVSKIWNTGVLNAQQSLPTSNLNQAAGQGSVSGTMASYSIDFSGDVTVTLSVVFASTASGMWAERQYIASMVR